MAEDEKKKKSEGLWVNLRRFFNGDPGHSDASSLQVALHGQYLAFSYTKYNNSGGGSGGNFDTRNIKIQTEVAGVLNSIVEDIIRDRVACYRNGTPYKEYDLPLDIHYIGSDGQAHSLGILRVHTVKVKDDIAENRIAVTFEASETIKYTTVFASKVVPIIISKIADKVVTKIDPIDTPFYTFAKMLNDVNSASVIYATASKLADLISGTSYNGWNGANNFNRNNNNGGGGSNYRGTNNRSATPRESPQAKDEPLF